jgi:hypothetical protein
MSVSLNFWPLISSAFDFANNLFPTLGAIAGVGIGFSLAIGAIAWLGTMLDRVFVKR